VGLAAVASALRAVEELGLGEKSRAHWQRPHR
jgi:hypothetical protein